MRIFVIGVLVLVLLAAGGLVGAQYAVESDAFRQWLAARLSDSLNRKVSFDENLTLTPGLTPRLRVQGLTVANPEWASAPYFAHIDELLLAPRPLALISGELVLDLLEAHGGEFWLEDNGEGEVSWPTGTNDKSGAARNWKLSEVTSAEITDFLIATPGDDGLRLELARVTASPAADSAREQMQATGSLNGRSLSASWTAGDTLWFLRTDSAQSLDIQIKLAGNDVNGALTIDRSATPPSISGTLESNKIVFESSDQSDNEKLIPSLSLPTAWLDTLQADLTWNIADLKLGAVALRDVRAQGRIQDGRLTLDPLDALVGKAPLHLRVAYQRSGELASLRASGELDDLNLRENIDWLSGKSPGAGFVDIRFVAQGVGNSTDAVAATLDGNLQLVMEKGQVSNAWLQRITSDLGSLINPWSDVEGQTPVRCLALRLLAEDGLVRVEQLVLDTREALIIGEGTINLRDGSLDITLSPDARSLDLLKLQLPINISGPLRAPDADPAPTAIIAKSGGAILEQIVSAGGLLNEDLDTAFSGSGAGCQASLQAYRQSSKREDGNGGTGKPAN